jgi:transcription elongation factor Elf1
LSLAHDPKKRKQFPIATGVLDYFPDAIAAVAEVSLAGNEQHHPGTPLHWDRTKSNDQSDALLRHMLDRGTRDADGIRHSAKAEGSLARAGHAAARDRGGRRKIDRSWNDHVYERELKQARENSQARAYTCVFCGEADTLDVSRVEEGCTHLVVDTDPSPAMLLCRNCALTNEPGHDTIEKRRI